MTNEDIRFKEIRLIGSDGEQLGVVTSKKAREMAENQGLDLVAVAPQARPPVCRIMDVGRYKYEQAKREKEAKKKQHVISVKEVKLRPKIDEHDFQTKLRNVIRFLKKQDKVKVTIMFRGREVTHPKIGTKLCERVAEEVADLGTVEKKAKLEGRNMTMVLAPKNS
ncbi:translation initiation factor IF-3 [Proteinivorax hydrogeniformans]|uniref:Translation initiation factor IF-3 n=1 Tax=Proteinivorax hydrogeniformans TaxID=1826727 RepID=A0AAU8HRL3_9FIRM